jgi:DNA-directed RNA polymerase sigma subunit (sigma70/sigma32)|tara:strand:- start:85 stop:672 length:588 start_codon:yes stop_codon:yes gene_type:complete
MSNKIDDIELVENIKNEKNVDHCLQKLIDRHTGIYLDIVNKYTHHANNLNKLDLIDEKDYNIYQTALKYKSDKGTKFPTFLGNETKWICLNKQNKLKKENKISFEDITEVDLTIEENDKTEVLDLFKKTIELSKKHEDKRVEKIFEMRYIIGEKNKVMPWKKISKELNMSIQGCINIHNSAIEDFKLELKDNNYV